MLQIDRVWEYLLQEEDANEPFVHYTVEVKRSDGGPPQRGIYLQENVNTNNSSKFRVHVHSDPVQVISLIPILLA